jgi:hypothetical protein
MIQKSNWISSAAASSILLLTITYFIPAPASALYATNITQEVLENLTASNNTMNNVTSANLTQLNATATDLLEEEPKNITIVNSNGIQYH